MVSTKDIAKAAVKMFISRDTWNGKTLVCVSTLLCGQEMAAVLTKVSGVPCQHGLAMPKFIMRFVLPDLYHMTKYFEEHSNNPAFISHAEQLVAEFKKVVPDALSFEEWLIAKGKWANGEKFGKLIDSVSTVPLPSGVGVGILVAVAATLVFYLIVAK